MTRGARRRACLALLGVICVFAGGAYSVYAAAARGGRAPVPPPSIVAKPAEGTWRTSASFAYTDRWRRARFQCSLDRARFTPCASPTRYPGPLAAGRHTFRVRALDSHRGRRLSRAASYRWLIDLLPPRPYIARHPNDPTSASYLTRASDPRSASAPTSASNARFAFTDGEAEVAFQCSIDTRAWRNCTSPISYRGLRVGEHHFRVRALDPPAPPSPAAQFDWHVTAQGGGGLMTGQGSGGLVAGQGSGKNFSISAGETASLLYPGAPPQAIPLTLTNPNDVPIFVTSVTVTVSGSPAGCDSASNISLTQANVSEAAPVEVPAHGSVTLPAQGRSTSTIQLVNLPVNQDACQNGRFPLNFTGSAHS